MEETHYLYLITRDDGEFYVGVTNNPRRREREHRSNSKTGNKYLKGHDFEFKILCEGLKEYIYSIEDATIIAYKAKLNSAKGGDLPTVSRGELNHSSKLIASDIHKIKYAYKYGYSHAEIADVFGVTRENIGAVVRGETWKSVDKEELRSTKAPPITCEQKQEIRRLKALGYLPIVISKMVGVSTKVASVYSKDIIYEKPDKERHFFRTTTKEQEYMMELRNNNHSCDEISSILGISSSTVSRQLKKYEIEVSLPTTQLKQEITNSIKMLRSTGSTYRQIAKELNISLSSAFKYGKQ